MKRSYGIRPRRHAYLAICVLLVTAAACGNDDNDNTPDSSQLPACMLARQVNTFTGVPYDGDITYNAQFESTYSYDEAGNLIGQTSDTKYDFSNGMKSTLRTAITHTYDQDGYRTRTVSQFNATDQEGKSTFDTNDDSFTYENGRLVKRNISYVGDGGTRNYTDQYQYNETGLLVKMLWGNDNSVWEFEYAGNTVSKITQTDAAGNKTSPLVQYNSAGLLIKTILTGNGYTSERRYSYTDDGLIARDEWFENGLKRSATAYEYDNKEHPNAYVYGKPKGHPFIPSTQPSVIYKHNALKTSFLDPSGDGTGWQVRQIDVRDFSYNDKGYPTEFTSKSMDGNGKNLYTSKSTFEYSRCQ